jgi:hypothetical protein
MGDANLDADHRACQSYWYLLQLLAPRLAPLDYPLDGGQTQHFVNFCQYAEYVSEWYAACYALATVSVPLKNLK